MLKKFTTKIPYSQLVAVQFHRQGDIKNNSAYLIVRGEENKHIPMPNEAELRNEKTMIMTTPVTDVLFFHIFSALKAVVPSTVEFSRVAPAENMVTDIKVSEEILDALFVKYAPFREDAVEALCTRTGMKRKIAVIVIDCAFDARQTAIYEANPREAIRDLNIVVDKLKKDHKEAVEELREYQKQFMQEDTKKEFLIHALKSSKFEMGIAPELTDRILTLSTCETDGDFDRILVLAYRTKGE